MSINRVLISGNLTRDPELRSTPNGFAVLNFSVAVNERRKNSATDEWEDFANFIECECYGKRAEALAKYLKKGAKVTIDGQLKYESWDDKNGGGRRSKTIVKVNDLEFMSTRKEGDNAPAPAPAPAAQPSAEEAVAQTFAGADVSEVPTSAYSDDDIDF